MRRAVSFLVKFAVSGLILYLALNWVNVGTVTSRLSQIDVRWAALGLLVPIAQNLILTLRWRQIIRECGAKLPVRQLFRYSMVALFFNQTLPSSIGGDAMRIWLVGKGSSWRIAAYSVFIDRVVGVVALAILVTICLPWTLTLIQNPIGQITLLVIGLGFIAAGIVFVGLAWERLAFLQRWAPTRHLAAVAKVSYKILRSPRSLTTIFSHSFVIHFLTVLSAWIAARSVGANLSLSYSLFLVLPVILIAIVPVSVAGWGVREGAMAAAFGYAGLPPSDGLIVSLLYGATYLVVGILGGLVWMLSGQEAKDEAAPSVEPL